MSDSQSLRSSLHVSLSTRHRFSRRFRTAPVNTPDYSHISNRLSFSTDEKLVHGQHVWISIELDGHRIKRIPGTITSVERTSQSNPNTYYCAQLQWASLPTSALGCANIVLQRINTAYLKLHSSHHRSA